MADHIVLGRQVVPSPGAARTSTARGKGSRGSDAVLDECVDALMGGAMGALLTVMRRAWRSEIPAGMSLAQFRALVYIAQHPGTSLGAVAEAYSISMPTASATVNRLISRELVAASDHAGDKRRVALFATKSGAAIERRASAKAREAVIQLVAEVSPAERTMMLDGARVIAKAFAPAAATGRSGK